MSPHLGFRFRKKGHKTSKVRKKKIEERRERALNMGNAVIILPSKWMDKNQPPLNLPLSSFGQLNLNSDGKTEKKVLKKMNQS